jgi:ubiquinone/menaquinone biosynthesis C-methylase UbiE
MNALGCSEAYRLWAPTYSDETAISFLDDRLVRAMTPPLQGLRLLDAGCGTGRRVRNAGAGISVALDISAEMLAAGIAEDGRLSGVEVVLGDVRNMPVPGRAFDVVWCRLVLGHLSEIDRAYAELGRVADKGATVIVTDFHPAAVEAGHRRSFRAGGEVIELEHHVHLAAEHVAAAREAGLALREIRDAAIASDARPFYERAGRLDAYHDHFGLPVVLALAFRREH